MPILKPVHSPHQKPARSFLNSWSPIRHKLASLLVIGTSALACGTVEPLSPTEELAEKFGQNFDPNHYGHFADSAYKISEKRDPDPDSPITCKGQNESVVDQKALIDYLIACKSRQRILEFFEQKKLNQNAPDEPKPVSETDRASEVKELQAVRSVKVDDITLEDDLFKIYALLGKDPELYTAFMKTIVTYRGWDINPEDTFRHPISTMQDGWTDCDDWAVEHYFWAHIHNYSPNLVIAVKPESSGTQQGSVKTLNAHAVVTYVDSDAGKTIVLDNQSWTELAPGETIEAYVQKTYPNEDLTIEFNGPYVGESK